MGVDTGRLRVVAAENLAAAESPQTEGRGQKPEPSAAEDYASPGPYIKAQRKRRGMSLDQLAAATKIPRAQLELIEADRYDELPAMVFAKGFMRCCARTLELDPDTVIGLLYERERTQLRKRRREGGADEPTGRKVATVVRRPGAGANGARSKVAPRSSLGSVQSQIQSQIQSRIQTQVLAAVAEIRERLPSARILMWIVVALFVALVVFIAFTLASGQAQTPMIRS